MCIVGSLSHESSTSFVFCAPDAIMQRAPRVVTHLYLLLLSYHFQFNC